MKPPRTPKAHAADSPDTGEAAAAVKNRQIAVRRQIIAALQHLGIPPDQWPDFVREFHTSPQAQTGYRESITPPPFHPPDFERLHESPKQWAKQADASWREYRDSFLQRVQADVDRGIDEEIPPEKTTRKIGRRGQNVTTDLRFEWAARRLMRTPWKDIAGESFHTDQVTKTATAVLNQAGWPTKTKRS